MDELLTRSLPLAITIFIVTAMFSLGLDLKPNQILEPLRNRRLLGVSLVASVVAAPLVALVLAALIPMDTSLRSGFLIYAVAAGAGAGPKYVHLAKGNAAFAVGLLALLIPLTVFGVPIAISPLVPDTQVERGDVLLRLLLVIALPVSLGLLLGARREHLAARLGPVMHRAAVTLMLLLLLQVCYVHFGAVLNLQSSALAAGLLFFPFAFATGYAMGGPERANRRALAIMTFARNGGIALTIAAQAFPYDPKVTTMILVMSLLTVVLTVSTSLLLARSPA